VTTGANASDKLSATAHQAAMVTKGGMEQMVQDKNAIIALPKEFGAR